MRSGRTSCCLGGQDGNETGPTDASKRDSVKGAGVDFVSSDDDDGRRFSQASRHHQPVLMPLLKYYGAGK